jgi:phosphonate transport system substrate-binding protein
LIASDFKDFEARLKAGQIDIAFVNPIIYPSASDVHEAVAMASEGAAGAQIRGLVIVRSDSDIVDYEDLKGRTVSYVGPKSVGGYLSQKLAMDKAGVSVSELKLEEARDNKQENVILSVYYGDADAGFINEDALHVADSYFPANQIRAVQRGAWMPSWAISVKRSLPQTVKTAIRDTLVGLPPDDPVLQALKVKSFVPGTDADYDPVRTAAGMPIPPR